MARALGLALELDTTVGQTLELAGPDILTLLELVEYVGELTGNERPVISLPDSLAMLQAGLMELLPGEPLMSRDNIRSLAVTMSARPGFRPSCWVLHRISCSAWHRRGWHRTRGSHGLTATGRVLRPTARMQRSDAALHLAGVH